MPNDTDDSAALIAKFLYAIVATALIGVGGIVALRIGRVEVDAALIA